MSLTIKIKPLVLVGCSGSGRSATIYNLTRNLPHKFQRLISYTTRKPRPSQMNNKHFYFVQQNWIKSNEDKFVTLTFSQNKNYYGLTGEEISRVIQQNKVPIFKMTLDAYRKNIGKTGSLFVKSGQKVRMTLSPLQNKDQKPQQNSNEKCPSNLLQDKQSCPVLYLLRDKKIECNALYIRIPSMKQLQRRLKFTPFSKQEQHQKIQKAKKQHNEVQKYFQQENIIGKNHDDNQQNGYDEDFDETIMRIKSRLFDLY